MITDPQTPTESSSIRARLSEDKSGWVCDVRLHILDMPTSSGFKVSISRLPALIKALEHTAATARENGLLSEAIR